DIVNIQLMDCSRFRVSTGSYAVYISQRCFFITSCQVSFGSEKQGFSETQRVPVFVCHPTTCTVRLQEVVVRIQKLGMGREQALGSIQHRVGTRRSVQAEVDFLAMVR